MVVVVGAFLVVIGGAIAVVWGRDIVANPVVDRSAGWLRPRDRENGSLLMPHWVAEYATAAACVAGGIGLLADAAWGRDLALAGAAALTYTSVNSMGWALARPDRRPYALPMAIGALGGFISIVVLFGSV
jgi:hypothetical protein